MYVTGRPCQDAHCRQVQLCAVGWVIATLIQIKYGAHGRHAKTQTLKEEIAWDKSNLAENLFLTSSLFTSRFSLCILLRGVIFHKQRLIHAVYTAMALDTIFFVATMVTYSIASVPISKLWYPKTPGFLLPGEVLVKFIQAFGAVNCIVDFLCAGVAFFLVYCIPLTKEVKAGVSLLVLGGFVTASCSIGRAAGIRPNDPDSPCKFESLLEG